MVGLGAVVPTSRIGPLCASGLLRPSHLRPRWDDSPSVLSGRASSYGANRLVLSHSHLITKGKRQRIKKTRLHLAPDKSRVRESDSVVH